jgi:chemotaxis signal transduction protein
VTYQFSKTPLPVRQPASTHLLFRLAQWEFAIPARLVKSLVPSPTVLPFPGTPEWLAGLLCSGSATIPAIDLRIRLGMYAGAPPGTAIVLQPLDVLAKNPPVALLVDKILDTASIRVSEIQTMRGSNPLPFREYLCGAWRARSRACYLLDTEKVIPVDLAEHLRTIFSSLR